MADQGSQQQTIIDLGQAVKRKHPGVYDSKSDAEVGRAMRDKHPDAYSRFVDVPLKTEPPPGILRKTAGVIGDVATGAAKGAASTAFHAGDLIRRGEIATAKAVGVPAEKIPEGVRDFIGLNRVIDKPDVKVATTPQGAAQKTGFYGEQAAEYAIPVAPELKGAEAAAKGTKAAEIGVKALREGVRGGIIGTAQSGDVKEGAKTAAVGAAAEPIAAGMKAAAPSLKSAAENIYRRVLLGGGGEKAIKVSADKVVPEALARKFWGATWNSMRGKVTENLAKAGKDVESTLDKMIEEADHTYYPTGDTTMRESPHTEEVLGKTVGEIKRDTAHRAIPPRDLPKIEGTSFEQGKGSPNRAKPPDIVMETEKGALSMRPVLDAVQNYAEKFKVGGVVVNQQAYDQALKVRDVLDQFGDDISLRDLVQVRRILDSAVDETKGHQLDLASSSLNSARKAASDSIRSYLGQEFPDLKAVNRTYHFWRSFDEVMENTEFRKSHTTHGAGPIEKAISLGGPMVGAAGGAILGSGGAGEIGLEAAVGAAGIAALAKLTQSTGFRTLTAVKLSELADALANADKQPGAAIKYINYLSEIVSRKPSEIPKTARPPGVPGR
jgi:hypothetical protein